VTETDVANLALSRLGAQEITGLTDGSRNADICKRHYERVRDEILSMFLWSCACVRKELQETSEIDWTENTEYALHEYCLNNSNVYVCSTAGTSAGSGGPSGTGSDIEDGTVHWNYIAALETNNTEYTYQYIKPYDSLRIISVSDSYGKEHVYRKEGMYLYSDTENALVRFIFRETDPEKWEELLRSAIILRLAWVISFPITQKENLSKAIQNEFLMVFSEARKATRQESQNRPQPADWWRTGI
jgi:hypothetical protein